jgi:hypothetical protein
VNDISDWKNKFSSILKCSCNDAQEVKRVVSELKPEVQKVLDLKKSGTKLLVMGFKDRVDISALQNAAKKRLDWWKFNRDQKKGLGGEKSPTPSSQ